MSKLFSNWFLLFLIILLAATLRIYSLSSTPIGMNPDELAIGYNSYSLLTTGKDEWGKTFPLSLKSFGDWKLPVYPVVDMPFIATLGLNEFSVRLPSALAGIGSVILIYFITLELFRKKTISLFSAFFMAISPWSIIFSRGAFEPNLALFIFLSALYLFIKYTQENRFSYFLCSSILFGITLFTYHGYDVFTPLFFAAIIFLFRKKVFTNKNSIIPIAIIGMFFALFLFSTFSSGSGGKLNTLSVFGNHDVIHDRSEIFRADAKNEVPILPKLLYNRTTAGLYQFGQNYLLSFSPTFLFDRGGVKLFYNVKGFGFLYLVDVVFILVGVASIFWNRDKNLSLIFLWLGLSPIPLAITAEVPDPTRIMAVLPVFIILSGYGANFIFEYIRRGTLIYKFVGLVLVIGFIFNFLFFLDLYFVHNNTFSAANEHFGYKQVADITRNYPDYKVVMTAPDNFPYISFLFYEKYDPNKFRKEVKYYPDKVEGLNSNFSYVQSFGRYSFVKQIDWDHLSPHTIYIDKTGTLDVDHIIYLPDRKPLFTYIIKN